MIKKQNRKALLGTPIFILPKHPTISLIFSDLFSYDFKL